MIGPVAIAEAARRLHLARLERRPTSMLTERWPDMTQSDAYAVQDAGLRLRTANGERICGAKLGFTSAAMRAALGVDSPNFGWLTDTMLLNNGVASMSDFIHPKAEPEIGFVLGRPLSGAGVSAQDVIAATEFLVPVIEIVDSRYEAFRFLAPDNTADNSSSGAVALGCTLTRPGSIDLRTVGVVMSVDGRIAHTAAGAAVAAHPANSVAWLVRSLARRGKGLGRGNLVIAGGLTGPTDLAAGSRLTLEIDRLGTTSLRMVE